ncbi:SLC13 family permease [Marinibaculum pumilum]|uniref:SLC13 family permease n=1 Tax=Marinibaculum pumilum TaxID=1766165 RepID=A0ABV7L4T2_9PROT
MSVALAISLAIFAVIAVREWLPPAIRIWHVMALGAVAMLATGQISPRDAFDAIDWNIILYLFGVFAIGHALFTSGVSQRIAERLALLRSPTASMAAFVLIFALLSAVVTNDAAAIIGTPIAFVLAHQTRTDARVFLIALCVTVTVGSMTTPIGNPQNLLIAASGQVPAPVLTFLLWLLVPTIVSLAIAVWWLSRGLTPPDSDAAAEPPSGPAALAAGEGGRIWPPVLAVVLLAVLVVGESLASAIAPDYGFPLGYAAAIACLPVFLFGRGRRQTFLHLDWATLVFFVAMFVVTGALVQSGSLQALLGDLRDRMTEPPVTAAIAFAGSQVFSNVPLVDMYLKLLTGFSTANLMMLAAVSTLAGNVFIISAASNVIVLQMAERLRGPSIGFSRFTLAVLPIGIVSTLLTAGWILLLDGPVRDALG